MDSRRPGGNYSAGLRQVEVNEKVGMTFSGAMRAFLRADPDIIMIGEMRDTETAGTAIEASLTGHLVLSTLHTNSAAESIVRLLDMDMDPFNFADAMIGILSQRLTKTLCTSC
ncbi:MAG TPA: ATPase, T2SS/T4P/T4SS family, partial [Gammaproteobacteria bacterium]|nr:ATPase, T2SS/T4P/T4SS family [Gammaproteobacteria bacterium]